MLSKSIRKVLILPWFGLIEKGVREDVEPKRTEVI